MGKGKVKLWVALVLVIGVMGFLIFNTTKSTQVYYMKPSEILKKIKTAPTEVYGHRMRVGGLVVSDGIKSSAARQRLTFKITDERGNFQKELIMVSMAQTKPNDSFMVNYKGIVPDTFKAGGMAIVDGHYGKNGVFEADKLMAKCPSKYEGATTKKASK